MTRFSDNASAGGRSIAAHAISGVVFTGDLSSVVSSRQLPLPAPADVEIPYGLSNLPQSAARLFVGRYDAMRELTDALRGEPGSTVAIHSVRGLDGVGKSELALQYALRSQDRYRVTWWISARSAESVELGLATLAQHLTLGSVSGRATSEAAGWAVAWLRSHGGWLLILDDVQHPEDIGLLQGLLSSSGDLLITSRRGDLGVADRTLELDVLRPVDSRDLLRHSADQSGSDDVDELAAALGHLPLALNQAAAYLAGTGVSVAAYLRQLRSLPLRVEAGPAAFTPALSITLDTVRSQEPFALEVLGLLACLAPENLPRLVVYGYGDDLDRVDRALDVLAFFSLLTIDAEFVRVHPAVHAVIRDLVREGAMFPASWNEWVTQAVRLLRRIVPFGDPREELASWQRWKQLIPHVVAVTDSWPPNAGITSDLSVLLRRAALFAATQGWYRQATALARKSLKTIATDAEVADDVADLASYLRSLGRHDELAELLRKTPSVSVDPPVQDRTDVLASSVPIGEPDHVFGRSDVAAELSDRADTLQELGHNDEVLSLRQRALAITEEILGFDHPDVAKRLSALGATLRELGRASDALPLLQRALVITEMAFGPDHPQVAARLNDLASALTDLGRVAEALPLQQRALVIAEEAFTDDHPAIADALANIAAILTDLGRPAEAIPLQSRAVAILEGALGPTHPDLAAALNNLATVLRATGRIDEALPLQQRALALTAGALGPDHPQVASRLSNLASSLRALGRIDEAISLQERALAITERTLGADHPDMAVRLGNLAIMLLDAGQVEKSLAYQQRALDITERALGPDHPGVATRLGGLSAALAAQGRHAEALRPLRRALGIIESSLGPDHPEVAVALTDLAGTLNALGRDVEATPLQQRALEIAEAQLGPNHPYVATLSENLATTLIHCGRLDEGLRLRQRVLAITEATLGPNHLEVALALHRLGMTLSALGRLEEGMAADARANGILERGEARHAGGSGARGDG
ncbi:tetratricopeptide (TPR) repeat protein [Micromonospora palomenae]|uniref:Tetratricopeptide (TPR) repeat protein n=1 Tax=Micromonospora palomenae TaxID=1461247 RepID=A0A561WWB9_9ACTN|nr:tetratricopeptide repeat protein [Micromonospora palomenae]TWG28160.1 tetratricopeptide (TPR) repeat protein [Micromonospora palomenae]